MKKGLLFLLIGLWWSAAVWANGVGVVDASVNANLRLLTSEVTVNAESQIATVITTQVFLNDLGVPGIPLDIKYAFPLPEGASATGLRWLHEGQWYEANIAGEPDTTLPGSGGNVHPNLVTYLGDTPLYFSIPQRLQRDSLLTVELTYVQLLPYSFGDVSFHYPGDYSLIQSGQVLQQSFSFNLTSPRTIDAITLLSGQTLTQLINTGNNANVETLMLEAPADEDYLLEYTLALDQLGLFAYSSIMDSANVPDELGNGFLTFIAEPDPGETTAIIDKVFTLIIDRSGSMSGDKIVQARNAAVYVMENLNEGDRFNIVDFSTSVSSFRSSHVLYTPATRNAAITYIQYLIANGGTNISGAFDVAIPQFASAGDSTANIMIFLTDGIPNGGITDTELLLAHVRDLADQTETLFSLFTFGIGSNVNTQLLALLASENNGLAEFLGNDELYGRITSFYQRIRNPVLINTQISFSPAAVTEVYPDPLPNLYKGSQMIISGRFTEGIPVTISLSGTAFNLPVNYDFTVDLADSLNDSYRFLTKIWAKSKIEHLLIAYFRLDPNSSEAQQLRLDIIDLSLSYGVISPFTSFSGGDPVGIEETELEQPETLIGDFELLGNYPNPFNPSTTIRVRIPHAIAGPMAVRIYNTLGQLVKTLRINISGPGTYEIFWDGTFESGLNAASGTYFYVVEMGKTLLAGKMTLLK